METYPLILIADVPDWVQVSEYIPEIDFTRHVLVAQDTTTRPILGDDLFAEVLTQKQAGTLTPANVALMEYITPALAVRAYLRFLTIAGIIHTPAGIVKFDSLDSTHISGDEKNAIGSMYQADAVRYEQKLKAYLEANANTYPLYTPDTECDTGAKNRLTGTSISGIRANTRNRRIRDAYR